MIPRIPFITTAIIASAVITACSETTSPDQPIPATLSSRPSEPTAEHSRRGGTFHVEKECSQYTRLAGGFCTITSSTLEAIKPGTRVVYASAAVPPVLDTDILLDPPGPSENTAFGHVVLNLTTLQGVVTISGGTGKFTWLHASAVVSHLTGPNFAWDGTYSFSDRN
jgi:hypothetical protein